MIIDLERRLFLLQKLRVFLSVDGIELRTIKDNATQYNSWFIASFLNLAIDNICNKFLNEKGLQKFITTYDLKNNNVDKTIGIIMAGNIPLVGFHDWLCCFLMGAKTKIKMSSKDNILFKSITDFLIGIEPQLQNEITFSDTTLKKCDAYLTMGSNYASNLFEQYFQKTPSLIRKSKTSVAILDGTESIHELNLFADDALTFFGLGCRNITKIYIPKNYDLKKIFPAFEKYKYFLEYRKYKNNYDYQLTILLLNKIPFQTNDFLLFIENKNLHAPLTCIYFEYYEDEKLLYETLQSSEAIQCIIGKNYLPFGKAQAPSLEDFPDNKNVIQFLKQV